MTKRDGEEEEEDRRRRRGADRRAEGGLEWSLREEEESRDGDREVGLERVRVRVLGVREGRRSKEAMTLSLYNY